MNVHWTKATKWPRLVLLVAPLQDMAKVFLPSSYQTALLHLGAGIVILYYRAHIMHFPVAR